MIQHQNDQTDADDVERNLSPSHDTFNERRLVCLLIFVVMVGYVWNAYLLWNRPYKQYL